MTEGVVYEKRLADDIGQKWRDLGRALGFHQASIDNIEREKGNNSKECCIEVLVRWLRRDGKEGATAGNLAEALTKIELKNLADRFPIKPSDTNRVSHSDVFFGTKIVFTETKLIYHATGLRHLSYRLVYKTL